MSTDQSNSSFENDNTRITKLIHPVETLYFAKNPEDGLVQAT